MDNHAYHADQALGHSRLLKVLRSPEHYKDSIENPMEPTAAMAFGTAVHAAVLEPELFDSQFGVMPKFDRRTKEGKEAAAKFESENLGKTMITEDDLNAIATIKNSIAQHIGAATKLKNGAAELSGFWTDVDSGVNCKIRPDWLIQDENGNVIGILDVKTTKDASLDGFSKAIANFGYDVQAAWYQEGAKQILGKELPFYFLCVETSAPYNVALYKSSSELIEVGRKKMRAGLEIFKWCTDTKQWPGYQPTGEEEEISLPRWSVTSAEAYDI
jgi:hypothetical protein